jgi:hypothetical protein
MKALGLLLALPLILAGCDAIDAARATKSMPEKMDKTIETMNKTECALKQGISFEALLKEEFGRVLVPVPFDLLPFAKKFAECSSASDLADVAYLWMKKLNEVTLDISNPTPDQVEEFNHKKLHIYSALQAVSGFVPRDKLENLIRVQIVEDGSYQDSVLELLMLRVQFFRDVRLENGLFTKGLVNVGRVEKAVEYADEIEYLARLSFAKSISIAVTGFIDPYPDVKEVFDPKSALKMWQTIKTKAERLKVEMKEYTGTGEDQALFVARKARMSKALSDIDKRISGWTGRP